MNTILDYKILLADSGAKENQDMFAYLARAIFHGNQDPGRFIDIGCYNPFLWNNTWSLESIGWTGILFDCDEKNIALCAKERKSPSYCLDVARREFFDVLNSLENKHFDYVSIDVDDASIAALKNMLDSGITFDLLTFEHAAGVESSVNSLRKDSREILHNAGYHIAFGDVSSEGDINTISIEPGPPIEDWWVSKDVFTKVFSEKSFMGISNFRCLQILLNMATKKDIPKISFEWFETGQFFLQHPGRAAIASAHCNIKLWPWMNGEEQTMWRVAYSQK